MATQTTGLERARRKKWLTGLVIGGISVTALAVGITFWGRAIRDSKPVQVPPSPGQDVQQQRFNVTFTRNLQDRPAFTVHAARAVSYQQSKSTTLEDVTVEIFGRKGDRSDVLRTHLCEYMPESGDFLSRGPVEIEMSAHSSNLPGTGVKGHRRIFLETSQVAYHQDDGLAETEAPVKFRLGTSSGTAQGMAYAARAGWLKLKHNVVVDVPQGTEKSPQPALKLTGSQLRYDKGERVVTLDGPVEVSQDPRRVIAERATVILDANNHVSRINLNGHTKALDVNPLRSIELNADSVQGDFDAASGQLRHLTAEKDVTGVSKAKGGTSRLTAQRLEMDLEGKHPKPLQGVATGNVHISMESQPVLNLPEKAGSGKGPEQKVLTSEKVRFTFRPDTSSLQNAETVGPGTLVLSPTDARTGERVITAGQFRMAFDARSHIESLRGLAPTQVLFRPPAAAPAGSPSQQSQADRLDAAFDAGTQTVREIMQTGNFQYRDGSRQASADQANYDVPTQRLQLLGHPQVWDPNSRVRCQKITIDTRNDTSVGEGKVQAVHMPGATPGPAPTQSHGLPTNVLADRMVAHRQSQTIHYEGHVRAWQGTDVVDSSALDVYRTQKRVSAGSHVVTSFMQAAGLVSGQGTAGKRKDEMRPVTIRADSFDYIDQGRRARYQGNVRMVTEGTTLQSDRLDVFLTQGDVADGSEVDHAEADGHVKVTQPGRIGTGDNAEYFAGPGKIVLTGGPPILIDKEKGSTTGQRLTFYIHDDRLFVDGGEQSPSLSKQRVAP